MGFINIALLQASNNLVTFGPYKPAANDPNDSGIPFPTAQPAYVNARAFKFLRLRLCLSDSNSDSSAEEPPATIKMCRASEDDLPLSLEVRRALTALIRQVEEQIAQLHERRNEAIAVLGSMEDDQDSEDGSDSEDDPGWEYDLVSEDEDDQGSEDDQDSEDGQDSEDDLSQSQEFWHLFDVTAQLCIKYVMAKKGLGWRL
ncbi:hypothetical protein PS2_044940 [Malus domestica]